MVDFIWIPEIPAGWEIPSPRIRGMRPRGVSVALFPPLSGCALRSIFAISEPFSGPRARWDDTRFVAILAIPIVAVKRKVSTATPLEN